MKTKNINPVEKHVEKGVLALCILAAGYLGYSALSSPIMFTDPTTSESAAVKDVETRISEAVEKMNTMRETNRGVVENMVNPWASGPNPNQDNNLPPELVAQALKYPKFSPGQNIGSGGRPVGPDNGPSLKTVASPLSPAAPVAEAMAPGHFIIRANDATATLAAAGAPVPPVTGPAPEVREIKPIKIQANYELQGNFANMNGKLPGKEIPAEKRIDPSLTEKRLVYLSVDVQRAEVNPDQNGSEDWQDLPKNNTEKVPTPVWNPDETRDASLDAIHPLRGVILEPRFYQSTSAPVAAAEGPTGGDTGPLPLIPTTPGAGGAGGGTSGSACGRAFADGADDADASSGWSGRDAGRGRSDARAG